MVAAKLASARALLRTEHLPPDESISSRRRFMILLRDLWLDRVICVSQANENQYATMGRNREKLVTVHNSVEPERFGQHNAREKVRRLIDATDQTIAIGAISRMSEERKGLRHFVEVARTLSHEDHRLRFFLAGDGPLKASLEKAAGESIVFLGEVPSRRRHGVELDVTDCYAAMDIFVQPSLSEGGPITVLEAMASGLPIVSTDVGMVKEAITDGVDGLIVPPADTKALVDAVESLCRDPDRARRMGETARKTVQQRFGEDVMIEKTLRVYGAVV
jgi:glycosyltransferase involved in cell wall biosynthesis